jgi:GT2 family glycosyltransferase
MTDVSIVFVNFKMKEDIFQALSSVLEDIASSPFSSTITVVDNSSNADGIREELALRFPSVRYLDAGGNVGFGKGNTAGFQSAPARYYFALNPDTIIPRDSKTVERMIRFMDQRPNVGAAGPKLLYPDGSLQYSCYRFNLTSILIKPWKHIRIEEKLPWTKKFVDGLLMADVDHNQTMPVDWILGAALMVRKEAVEKVGWFDERYFMYLEDCDWCHAIWKNGFTVHYVHDVEIVHAHGRKSAAVPGIRALFVNKVARIHLMSWFKYVLKWFGEHRSYAKHS